MIDNNNIFIVETEVGDYEDRHRTILYAGNNNNERACKQANSKYAQYTDTTVYFSIWRDGKRVASIMREGDSNKWTPCFGDISEFQIIEMFFNSIGEQIKPPSIKTVMEIRIEIDKVFRKPCTPEQCIETITRIHQLLLNEGFK